LALLPARAPVAAEHQAEADYGDGDDDQERAAEVKFPEEQNHDDCPFSDDEMLR
jgi:hypothetical protein